MRSFRTGKQAIQLFCSAASFSLRGGRVPSKVLFTAKHLTVFGLFRIALSKRRGRRKKRKKDVKIGGVEPRKEVRTLKDIERFYHTQIEEMPMDIADLL